MGRSRSCERRRSRSRSRSRDRDRRKQRSRSRSQDRDRRRQRSRSRSKDRVPRKDSRRDRSRSKDRHRRRSRSAGRDRDKRRTRSRSREATQLDQNQRPSRPASEARGREPSEPPLPGPPPLPTASHAPLPSAVPASTSTATPTLTAEQAAAEEKRRRLEAFKAKLSSAQPASASAKPAQPPAATAGVAEGLFGQDDDDDSSTKVVLPTAAELIAARRAREDAEEAAAAEQRRARAEARAAALAAEYGGAFYPGDPQAGAGGPGAGPTAPPVEEEEVDPLDAFMAGEVLPEVRARQEAEAAAKEAERIRAAELLAQGKGPTRPSVLSDSEEEPEPDSRIQIPANKIKYMVGPGGVKIMEIQRKSKCRIQVLKEEDDLNRGWGSGIASAVQQQAQAAIKLRQQQQQAALQRKYKMQAKADKAAKVVLLGTGPGAEQQPQAAGFVPEGKAQEQPPPEEPSSSGDEEPVANAPPRKMATLLLYGDHKAIEACEKLIYEAIDNKAQKKAQREKEYAKKRDEKSRNRQLYVLRHTRDYETLEVPVGTSRAEVKKAYRRLALLWHPDKHPNNVEEAQAKFQTIQKAYDSLMSTNEDERIEALTGR